jgi:hypothetical protein
LALQAFVNAMAHGALCEPSTSLGAGQQLHVVAVRIFEVDAAAAFKGEVGVAPGRYRARRTQ